MRRILTLLMLVVAGGCGGDGGEGTEAVCGDGVLGTGEACDGAELGGEDCASQGFAFGELACTAECTLDTSGCGGSADCGNNTIDGDEQCDALDLGGASCTTLGFVSGALGCRADCSFDTSTCTPPTCGDGAAEGFEECDGTDLDSRDCTDFGQQNGALACAGDCTFDTSGCVTPTCGDGVGEGDEACDGSDLRGRDCLSLGFLTGIVACSSECTFTTAGCVGSSATCADGIIEGPEQCDGLDLQGADCISQGFLGGTLLCGPTCQYLTTSCTGGGPTCGDGTAEGDEACDGADLAGATCEDFGFTGGTLGCSPACGFTFFQCTADTTCGDALAEGLEACDGADVRGQTCAGLGLQGGTLGCDPSCLLLDVSACSGAPVCGNAIADPLEVCDGTDLRGRTCEVIGFGTGTLACNDTCTAFDPSACTAGPMCGDGVASGLEACDDTDLRGQTCLGLGLLDGTLACAPSCLVFDTSGCGNAPACGNDEAEPLEVCDGTDLRALNSCASFGYAAGTPGCLSTCGGYDLSGCGAHPNCGNNFIDFSFTPEQCDGPALGLGSCLSLGYSSGTLACNGNCSYDVSGCVAP